MDSEAPGLRETLDTAMLADDRHWAKYYRGAPQQQKFSRAFSFSDRARYYLPDEMVSDAVNRLLNNLEQVNIPMTLLSQYLPMQYRRVRDGLVKTARRTCCWTILGIASTTTYMLQLEKGESKRCGRPCSLIWTAL